MQPEQAKRSSIVWGEDLVDVKLYLRIAPLLIAAGAIGALMVHTEAPMRWLSQANTESLVLTRVTQ